MNDLNLTTHGFEIRRQFVSAQLVKQIIEDIARSLPGDHPYGVRNADKKIASIQRMVINHEFLRLASSILNSNAKIIRVIFFDKTPTQNWLVAWHQDKTIALANKIEVNGWGPWSVKDHTHHVQPPLHIVENMVTFRLHLDDADRNNGCLKVIPKSHHLGFLKQADISQLTASHQAYYCEVKKGDMVIMSPLLLHSSAKSMTPSHRRVVHIEYGGFDLPNGMNWA